VSTKLREQVAALLQKNNQSHRREKSQSCPGLFSGRLFDTNGVRFTPTHALKNGKRYRYYTSQASIRQTGSKPLVTRFPAEGLEQLVKSQMRVLLQSPEKVTRGIEDGPSKDAAGEHARAMARDWPTLDVSKQNEFIRNTLKRVVLGQTTLTIELNKAELVAALLSENAEALTSLNRDKSEILKLTSDFQFFRRGRELRLASAHAGSCFEAAPTMSLAKAVARARGWYERILAGELNSIDQLAQSASLTRRYVRRVLPFATLSPQITKAILMGKHRPNLAVAEILRGVPLYWQEQEERFLR
jgi:hypothetical protein